ncbi:tyrosine-protein phosphatase [Demequina muriae]|uniref:Tyrosine-protein phosphatase n=1 Tax=Demequina muriae TaxID=3051664 RepID=A0ABT8GI88_9MICO|nr:tyrosine-protein phosphatase [Demequina sp. EGI L300058]MDN4481151.1 tyrosine-protein phosphatase [Demequina sp. EGI L300058]
MPASRGSGDAVRRLRSVLGWGGIYLRHRVMSRATPRLANVRDLADAGPGIVRDMAYRSDAPMAGDAAPGGDLRWPPATVVDLRGAGEKEPSHPLAGASRIVGIDVLDAAALTGGTRGSLDSLADLYAVMTAPAAAPRLTRAVGELARAEAPVLVHCSAGKDRTGVVTALTLRLLGVEHDRVVADYVLTQHHMPRVLARMLAGTRSSIGGTPLTSVPREILAAPAAAIETVLHAWDAHEGGVEGWYLAHGGDRATLATLRGRLLA